MEVHHPHHPTHKKDWKEYITEFIMLFTAVSLGFLAENIREQYIEKERAHEYLQHLESDIDNNIHFIDSLIVADNQLILKFEKAFLYLATSTSVDLDSLYKNLPSNVNRFLSKNDTYEQMKSSGSLRYVKDQALLDLILDYSNAAQAAESRSTQMETEFTTTHWMIAVNSFMTEAHTISEYKRIRKGELGILDDSITKSIIDSNYQSNENILNNIPLRKSIVGGQELQTIKNRLMPYLIRRMGLVVNTMKFMGYAKSKGLTLKNYLRSMH
ncbi:hypothetical protein LBMAG23_13530 [Bacteroidota bacterium]|nr:hypothetical protein LBMAG23_13530 [Bacteroidota bacterium]